MTKLVLAVAPASRRRIEALLLEHTAGRWRHWITIHPLSPRTKAENDSELHELASISDTPIFAAMTLTSGWLTITHPHIRRLQSDLFLSELVRWLDAEGLTWQSGLRTLEGLSGFQLGNEGDWRGQFAKVDPLVGPRVAKALLAQLRVVRMNELAGFLTATGDFDYNVYFTGNDPHSGDFAMVAPLASRIDGDKLWEASKLPKDIPDGARIRLFSDGAWSGGETEKRIKCLTKECQKKAAYVRPTQTLHVSLGFATTNAMSRVKTRGDKFTAQNVLAGFELDCRNVLDPKAGLGQGLAFVDEDVNSFVDPANPKTFFEFCKNLGAMVYPNRPLGTMNIASTIAFEHSLPKAMLPFFIFGGGQVKASDGTLFGWKPLLQSKHVQMPAQNNPEHHCPECALK